MNFRSFEPSNEFLELLMIYCAIIICFPKEKAWPLTSSKGPAPTGGSHESAAHKGQAHGGPHPPQPWVRRGPGPRAVHGRHPKSAREEDGEASWLASQSGKVAAADGRTAVDDGGKGKEEGALTMRQGGKGNGRRRSDSVPRTRARGWRPGERGGRVREKGGGVSMAGRRGKRKMGLTDR